ncbi:protein kinase C, brain isozyme-like [Ctenocephalides felis]|uniref:protein kinase C, brain isozyme-like n=1 Tax=Ctenocephalides felis TaxID=7515 RepID=UPI000E6E44B1|nr:protein kinase C, brain isozyme-like [Ctenocephalides felis]
MPLTPRNSLYVPALEMKISNDVENVSHFLQEYTYKKITPCDVCSEVLRGHTRQGLRCKTCKANAHVDCASRLPRCQSKARLLRRQRSTSEIEPTVEDQSEFILCPFTNLYHDDLFVVFDKYKGLQKFVVKVVSW